MNGTIDRRLRRLEGSKPATASEGDIRVCFIGRTGYPDPTPEELAQCSMVVRFVRPGDVRQ